MKIKKRILSLALAGTMALGLMPGMTMMALADGETSYTLTIPSTLTVLNSGWNATDGISATGTLASGKKLTVTASSANSWALKQQDGSETVSYTMKETSDGAAKTAWEFTTLPGRAPLGIDVADYSDKPAGTYQDTVTFTASVEDAITAVDLSTLTADYVAKDGETLTGTLAANVKISIADGATVTLKDANITNLGKNCDWAGINCSNDATIILKGTNTICAGRDSVDYNNYPGIWIAPNKTLTIDGDGSLTAYSNATNPGGAGIGGGYLVNCGNIVINGGTITATGDGGLAAGIGSGQQSTCGDITINGGTITATGGGGAAGIGSGCTYGEPTSSCGNITIANTVTKVTATGGYGTNSIGAGQNSACGTVTIGGVEGAISESPFTYEP